MIKPHDPLVHGPPATASEADDASRFAACCAVASCDRPALPTVDDRSHEVGATWAPACEPESRRPLADLSMIVCMATAKVRSHANERGCQVRLELPNQPLLIMASASQLEVALINLLRGAVDARATAIVLSARTDGPRVQVHMEDNREPAVANVAPGNSSELARSIARRIVEDHGGKLDLVHDDQCGASLWLTLPRHFDAGVTTE